MLIEGLVLVDIDSNIRRGIGGFDVTGLSVHT